MDEGTEINILGEFGLIEYLTKNIEVKNASSILGVGDDSAIIDNFGKQSVITTDLLIEGIHFDLSYTPLKHLGYKSIIVNISDIYAMNATPTQILVGVGFSNRFSLEALSEFYEGIYIACNKYGLDLLGGDTSNSKKGFIISITAIGEVAPNQYVRRSTANMGDVLCASGDLGGAYLGLQLLEREKGGFLENPRVQFDLESESYVMGRHLKPDARKDIIKMLAELKITPTSMIDISDGLSSDLLHICNASHLGCVLYENKIPIHKDTLTTANKFNLNPITCALNGGEDYELLFTVRKDDINAVIQSEDISIIGYMTNVEEGTNIIRMNGEKMSISASGWTAF